MFNTTTNYTINTVPQSKKDIITRLFKEGHITLDEVMELMDRPAVNLTPIPAPASWPVTTPWDTPSRYPWDTVMYAVK